MLKVSANMKTANPDLTSRWCKQHAPGPHNIYNTESTIEDFVPVGFNDLMYVCMYVTMTADRQ